MSVDFRSPMSVASMTDTDSIDDFRRHDVDSPLSEQQLDSPEFKGARCTGPQPPLCADSQEVIGTETKKTPCAEVTEQPPCIDRLSHSKRFIYTTSASANLAVLSCCGVSRNDGEGPAGFAYVLRTADNRKRSADLYLGLHVPADLAAYNSLWVGLNVAASCGVTEVLVLSNSEQLVGQMNSYDPQMGAKVLKLHLQAMHLLKQRGMTAHFQLARPDDAEFAEAMQMAQGVADRYC